MRSRCRRKTDRPPERPSKPRSIYFTKHGVYHLRSDHIALNALTAALSTAVLYPLDSIAARLWVQYATESHVGLDSRSQIGTCCDTAQDAAAIARAGFASSNDRRKLYAGISEAVGKEALESTLVGILHSSLPRRISHSLLASMLLRALARAFTEPIATIIVRRQATAQTRKQVIDTLSAQVEEGKGGLWAGYWATLILTARPSIVVLVHHILRALTGIKGGILARIITEFALCSVSAMQTCARAGVEKSMGPKNLDTGRLMLEISRRMLHLGTAAVTRSVIASAMLRISALSLYMLRPILLSEDAVTKSIRESAPAADRELVDNADYLTTAAGAAGVRNHGGIESISGGGSSVVDAVSQLVGDYVEDLPGERYWFWDRDRRH